MRPTGSVRARGAKQATPLRNRLTLLNGTWTTEEAKRLGAADCEGSGSTRLKWSKQRLASRVSRAIPMRRNSSARREFLERADSRTGIARWRRRQSWRAALFNTNEFLYVD